MTLVENRFHVYWRCETDGIHGKNAQNAINHARDNPEHEISLFIGGKKIVP